MGRLIVNSGVRRHWLRLAWVGSRAIVIRVLLILIRIVDGTIAISATAATVGRLSDGSRVGLVEAIFGELFVKGVSVDAEPGRGLDLYAIAGLKNLLDQLAFDAADDTIVQVVGIRPGGADALAYKLGA